MKFEYILIVACMSIMVGSVALVTAVFFGSKLWGKINMRKSERILFNLFLAMKAIKFKVMKIRMDDYILHLLKVHDEITAVEVRFNQAKKNFAARTKYELIDIYDDYNGHRYIKIHTPKHGEMIFELKDYFRVILNRKIFEEVLKCAPPEANPKTVEELTRKPTLKLIK